MNWSLTFHFKNYSKTEMTLKAKDSISAVRRGLRKLKLVNVLIKDTDIKSIEIEKED